MFPFLIVSFFLHRLQGFVGVVIKRWLDNAFQVKYRLGHLTSYQKVSSNRRSLPSQDPLWE